MNLLLTICLIPFLCHDAHKARVAKSRLGCDQIAQQYRDATGSRDDFVLGFKTKEQHRVLVCLGKKGLGQ